MWREGDEEEDQAVSGGHGGQPGSRKMLKQHYLKMAFLEKIEKNTKNGGHSSICKLTQTPYFKKKDLKTIQR